MEYLQIDTQSPQAYVPLVCGWRPTVDYPLEDLRNCRADAEEEIEGCISTLQSLKPHVAAVHAFFVSKIYANIYLILVSGPLRKPLLPHAYIERIDAIVAPWKDFYKLAIQTIRWPWDEDSFLTYVPNRENLDPEEEGQAYDTCYSWLTLDLTANRRYHWSDLL
ncbi:unnamed protein product [Cyclocybe aegerita]|uniref:Uncharacterized protein n=1 Tax=Cyclocybe aegerita TaxID=1973307 RepID=A0A8S0WY65_CYCAE|nr:unnamed protein product [Cyclocybe aegerita]